MKKKIVLIDDSDTKRDGFQMRIDGSSMVFQHFFNLQSGLKYIASHKSDVGMVLLDRWGTCNESYHKPILNELMALCDSSSIPMLSASGDMGVFDKYPSVRQVKLREMMRPEFMDILRELCVEL